MTMMKFKSITNICSTVLSLSILCFLSVAQAQPMDPAPDAPDSPPSPVAPAATSPDPAETVSTSIRCTSSGGKFTTVAEQGSERAVLFTWKTTEFGPEYTPEKRCQIVSAKFNNFVQENGGSFANLSLTIDSVNGYPVICMKKTGVGSCRVLFTLKKENQSQAEKIILSLQDPGSIGSDGINETRIPSVKLSEWSKRKLSAKKSNTPISVKKKPPTRKGKFK
jgi:Circadian oscillating protein COP23